VQNFIEGYGTDTLEALQNGRGERVKYFITESVPKDPRNLEMLKADNAMIHRFNGMLARGEIKQVHAMFPHVSLKEIRYHLMDLYKSNATGEPFYQIPRDHQNPHIADTLYRIKTHKKPYQPDADMRSFNQLILEAPEKLGIMEKLYKQGEKSKLRAIFPSVEDYEIRLWLDKHGRDGNKNASRIDKTPTQQNMAHDEWEGDILPDFTARGRKMLKALSLDEAREHHNLLGKFKGLYNSETQKVGRLDHATTKEGATEHAQAFLALSHIHSKLTGDSSLDTKTLTQHHQAAAAHFMAAVDVTKGLRDNHGVSHSKIADLHDGAAKTRWNMTGDHTSGDPKLKGDKGAEAFLSVGKEQVKGGLGKSLNLAKSILDSAIGKRLSSLRHSYGDMDHDTSIGSKENWNSQLQKHSPNINNGGVRSNGSGTRDEKISELHMSHALAHAHTEIADHFEKTTRSDTGALRDLALHLANKHLDYANKMHDHIEGHPKDYQKEAKENYLDHSGNGGVNKVATHSRAMANVSDTPEYHKAHTLLGNYLQHKRNNGSNGNSMKKSVEFINNTVENSLINSSNGEPLLYIGVE